MLACLLLLFTAVDESLPDLASFAAGPAVVGHEEELLARIEALLPAGARVERDALGSLLVRFDELPVADLYSVGVDEPGFVVSALREDGWLRLRYLGPTAREAAFHRDHEGRPVEVLTRKGLVPGVIAIDSIHLRRPRPEALGEEHLWLDVGADSPAGAAALGIELLDPVAWHEVVVLPDGSVAGPDVGRRAAALALLAALRHVGADALPPGTAVAFVAQTQVGRGTPSRGEEAVLRRSQPARHHRLSVREATASPAAGGPDELAVPARYVGSPVEVVTQRDVAALAGALATRLGGRDAPVVPPPRPAALRTPPAILGSPGDVLPLLSRLVAAQGVSGHEGPVADELVGQLAQIGFDGLAASPARGIELGAVPRGRPFFDDAGNLVLVLGRGERTLAFVAHLDEIGLEVTALRDDGLLETRGRGGFHPHLYQATVLELVTGAGVLSALAVPANDPDAPRLLDVGARTPGEAEVYGVRVGDPATVPKEVRRLGGTRIAGRALDDRVGCTALLLALQEIDASALDRTLVFAWAVEEEVGLNGADALARALRPVPETVFAVDTFVTSDSPREDPRYAFAPLGGGPVLRALDNTSLTPRRVLDRVRQIAARHALPLQTGTMGGGNDGSRFVPEGSIDCPLAWPQRCSHSRVETADLRDIEHLAALVAAVAAEY